jgi:hypothetical protein
MRTWAPHELAVLMSVYASHAASGEASGWEVGATELGDPQFYVIGPAPELDCLATISRVGRIYVLENGVGRVIDEGLSLDRVAASAKAAARTRPLSLVARMTLGLAAFRVAVEEKIEPLAVESEELLLRFAPQIASMI